MARTIQDLRQMQALPLNLKIELTKSRIRQWVHEFGEEGVYVSFSGGKDSTVLLHLVREMYPNVEAVFCDTGLEYPEIREFVKTFDNVTWLKPKKNFKRIIEEDGYPFISKDVAQCLHDIRRQSEINHIDRRETNLYMKRMKPDSEYAKKYPHFAKTRYRYEFLLDAPFNITHVCCDIMKKNPAKKFEKETGKKPFLATMAVESALRTTKWIEDGCNAFESKRPKSKPMSFWTEQDVLAYIKKYNVQICSVYGDIVVKSDTIPEGQMTMFDCGICDTETELLTTTGCDRTGCMFCGFGCHLQKAGEGNFERMKITHPKQYEWIMKPRAEGGLGYKEVIDWLNENGGLNIRY